MQVRVDTNILREALNKILTVVDKKNTRPILTYTLVEISENSVNRN